MDDKYIDDVNISRKRCNDKECQNSKRPTEKKYLYVYSSHLVMSMS